MTARLAAVAFCVLLNFAWMSFATAQTILTTPASPVAVGQGEIYPTTDTDDPLAPLTNPGFMGFLAERNQVMVGFYPTHSSWRLPAEYHRSSDFGYASRAINIGFDRATLHKFFNIDSPFSIGFGYQEAKYDFGESTYYYDENHYLGVYDTYETSRGFSVGIGYHGKVLQAGVGLNHKYLFLTHGPSGNSHPTSSDFGIVLQSAAERFFWKDDSRRTWQPTITPMISCVVSNYGAKYSATGSDQAYLLQRKSSIGLNLAVGLRSLYFAQGRVSLISLALGEQIGDDDITSEDRNGHEYYKNIFGDLQPINDLVLGKPHQTVYRRQGVEITLLETASVRWGHIKNDRSYYSTNYQYTTNGYGIRLAGLLKIVESEAPLHLTPFLDRVLHHLDLQYHYGTEHADPDQSNAGSGISYHEIALLWRQ